MEKKLINFSDYNQLILRKTIKNLRKILHIKAIKIEYDSWNGSKTEPTIAKEKQAAPTTTVATANNTTTGIVPFTRILLIFFYHIYFVLGVVLVE